MTGGLRRRARKTVRRIGATALVRALIAAAVVLPRRSGLALFALLGSLAYRFCRRDRERALANLERAFPAAPPPVIAALARGSFRALGKNTLDALRLVRLSRTGVLGLCSITGEEHLRLACGRGRGVIGLTGHIGCWELMAAFLTARGYTVGVIARRLRNETLGRMLVRMRRRHGIESYERGRGALAGYRALKGGAILGLLADQDIDVDGMMVPFFDVPAYTPVGPAVFALRSGAAVVPMAINMQPDGRHRVTILPELEIPGAQLPERERIGILTRRCSEAIETLVRLYPQQWVWFHDRWRRRPEELEKRAENGYLGVDGARMG